MIARMQTKGFASGILFAAIGTAGLAWSFQYPMGSARQMGPGYFPAIVFGILLLLGIAIGWKAWSDQAREPLEAVVWRPLVVIVGALLLFALTIRPLGFVVASAGLIVVSMMAGTRLTLVQRLALAAGLTALCWLIFILGLGLRIPTWPEFGA